jgi:hypothetical protein
MCHENLISTGHMNPQQSQGLQRSCMIKDTDKPTNTDKKQGPVPDGGLNDEVSIE